MLSFITFILFLLKSNFFDAIPHVQDREKEPFIFVIHRVWYITVCSTKKKQDEIWTTKLLLMFQESLEYKDV
jgi:hypothetical protein